MRFTDDLCFCQSGTLLRSLAVVVQPPIWCLLCHVLSLGFQQNHEPHVDDVAPVLIVVAPVPFVF